MVGRWRRFTGDGLDREGLGWDEAVRGHVFQQALAELGRGGALVEVVLQVGAADEQFAVSDAGFIEQAEFAVGEPVVDDVDDGAEVVGIARQVHGLAAAHQIPPLVVAHPLVGEGGQSRMGRVTVDAERMRRLFVGPCGVPEDAGEADGVSPPCSGVRVP